MNTKCRKNMLPIMRETFQESLYITVVELSIGNPFMGMVGFIVIICVVAAVVVVGSVTLYCRRCGCRRNAAPVTEAAEVGEQGDGFVFADRGYCRSC